MLNESIVLLFRCYLVLEATYLLLRQLHSRINEYNLWANGHKKHVKIMLVFVFHKTASSHTYNKSFLWVQQKCWTKLIFIVLKILQYTYMLTNYFFHIKTGAPLNVNSFIFFLDPLKLIQATVLRNENSVRKNV